MYVTLSQKGWMSLSEVVRFTGRHPETVRKWMTDPRHPKPTKIGKRQYWRREEIEAYYK